MMWSTYPLATARGMATCVVINRRDPQAPHGIGTMVLTSSHLLAATPRGPFYLAFRESRPGQNPAVGFLELRAPDPSDHPFVRHPFYDLAVLRLDIPPEFADTIAFTSFIKESAVGSRATEGHAGDEVSVLGFPHVFPGTEGAFPLLRGGRIASHSAIGGSNPEEFLVNTSVFAGDSGGPVFAGRRNGTPRLVGMIVERVAEEKSGVPLAIAVNASAIRETLQLQAQTERDSGAGNSSKPAKATRSKYSRVKLVGPPKTLSEMLKLWKQR